MCGGGDFFKPFKATLDIIDPFGVGHKGGVAKDALAKPRIPRLRRPNTDTDFGAADAAAQRQKDLLAVAFGLDDTKTTGVSGLGSVPKSLLTPHQTLGGY